MNKEKKSLAIDLLGKGTNISEVARQVDVSRRTIYNWLDDPEFKIQVSRKTRSIITTELTFAIPQILPSIKTIIELRDDELVKPSVRLKAANDIIAITERLAESSATEELDALRGIVESISIKQIEQVEQ